MPTESGFTHTYPACPVIRVNPCRPGTSCLIASGLFLLTLMPYATVAAQSPVWKAEGPGPNTQGQVENVPDLEVVGAINVVTPHPTDANILYAGGANGGIWRSANAMAASPVWQRMTDTHQSLSIGALEYDPTDSTNRTLVAGIGRFSSFLRLGGSRTGLLRTINDGATWTALNGGGALTGLNISGIAPRGTTIVISADAADTFSDQGIWRSTNTGNSWVHISGGSGTGLPVGRSYDLVGDPNDPARLFTNGGSSGIYRSTDTGATWSKVSNAAMDGILSSGISNVELAMGKHNNVYAALVRGGQLAGMFRSGDGGTTWTAMDLPSTVEGGIHPGGQGSIHLSLAADPNHANMVYIGGDRQAGPLPNSIGARDWSGRLFRGDASLPAGSQFVHLTHSNTSGAAGGGTASSSAPHADSRDMDVAANGVVIEGDDGGIYRRTSPQTNTGDWFSMNGNLQTTEFHNIAWDANADIVIGGTQDTGTPEQSQPANERWRSVSTADGGDVAVDDLSSPQLSVRYSSWQNLGAFRRRVYDSSNVLQSQVFPSLSVIGGGAALVRQFTTPLALNTITPTRLIIGGANSVYESLDQGDTITEIGPGIRANGSGQDTIAYGAAGNPDILYVGSGTRVFVRTAAHPAPLTVSAAFPGNSLIMGVAIDPDNAQRAYVVDTANVYMTTDAGATWTSITGNLGTLNPGTLQSIAYSTRVTNNEVVVGSTVGVFNAPGPNFHNWSTLGTGLPAVPVYELEYDRKDEVLLAGTLGRGAWTLRGSGPPPPASSRELPWMRLFLD